MPEAFNEIQNSETARTSNPYAALTNLSNDGETIVLRDSTRTSASSIDGQRHLSLTMLRVSTSVVGTPAASKVDKPESPGMLKAPGKTAKRWLNKLNPNSWFSWHVTKSKETTAESPEHPSEDPSASECAVEDEVRTPASRKASLKPPGKATSFLDGLKSWRPPKVKLPKVKMPKWFAAKPKGEAESTLKELPPVPGLHLNAWRAPLPPTDAPDAPAAAVEDKLDTPVKESNKGLLNKFPLGWRAPLPPTCTDASDAPAAAVEDKLDTPVKESNKGLLNKFKSWVPKMPKIKNPWKTSTSDSTARDSTQALEAYSRPSSSDPKKPEILDWIKSNSNESTPRADTDPPVVCPNHSEAYKECKA